MADTEGLSVEMADRAAGKSRAFPINGPPALSIEALLPAHRGQRMMYVLLYHYSHGRDAYGLELRKTPAGRRGNADVGHEQHAAERRSEERRVGKGGVRTGRCRGTPDKKKK